MYICGGDMSSGGVGTCGWVSHTVEAAVKKANTLDGDDVDEDDDEDEENEFAVVNKGASWDASDSSAWDVEVDVDMIMDGISWTMMHAKT